MASASLIIQRQLSNITIYLWGNRIVQQHDEDGRNRNCSIHSQGRTLECTQTCNCARTRWRIRLKHFINPFGGHTLTCSMHNKYIKTFLFPHIF